MHTSQLECFVTLASTLNYVKTAEQLGLTQPAVSKQIQSLEQELGARLFFRTTRSVSLTQIGQQFLPNASTMLSTYYKSKEQIAGFRNSGRHSLRIGYSDPNAVDRISKVLRLVLKENENIVPELSYEQTDANLAKLSHGHIDLIVSMKDAKFSDEQVIFKKLREEAFCCAVCRTHPLAAVIQQNAAFENTISTEDLWQYRQIIAIPPYLMKNQFSRGRRIVPVNDDMDNIICINTNEAYALVLAGLGYAYIPHHLIMEHPDLLVWEWKETPHAPFGVYYRKAHGEEKDADIKTFIRNAEIIYK